jgi:hypothetical protein
MTILLPRLWRWLTQAPERGRAADRGARAAIAIWILVPVAIALLSWQELALTPSGGLDPSWQAALHMALYHDVSFGNHFIFTYGPLGFLSAPTLWYGATGVGAVLYTLLLRVALAGALFAAARRSYGDVAGALIALAVCAVSLNATEAIPFFVFGVLVVATARSERRLCAAMALGGAIAGAELLNKESTGVEIAVLAVLMSLAARGRRRHHVPIVIASLLATLLVLWVASGQAIGELAAYARSADQIISGYTAAMGTTGPGLSWQYVAAPLVFAVGLFAALQMTADASPRQRRGIVAMWLAFSFLEFKEGFVRHDAGHAAEYFEALAGGLLALGWRDSRRRLGLLAAAGVFVIALAAVGVYDDAALRTLVTPVGGTAHAASDLSDALTEGGSITAAGRASIRRQYPLDAATLAQLAGRTVDVEPSDAAIAWAYRLDWRPLPVIQSYSAYTPTLDRDDAAALASSYAPQRILRTRGGGIDGRYQPFDEPLTTRELLCRYRQLVATPRLQVLARGGDRCARTVALRTVHAAWGQPVKVPAPPDGRSVVFVRISGVQVGGIEDLVSLLYKPASRNVLLDGVAHRLVEATAGDGLLLRAPAGVDYPAPFGLAPNSATIAVTENGQSASGGRPITLSFFSQTVRGSPVEAEHLG